MHRLALTLCLPLLLLGSSLAAAEPVGQATRVQRFAWQTPPQTPRAALYRLGSVERNARLETASAGALEVVFTDSSRLTLGSASQIVVDDYVYAGTQGTATQSLKMTRGLFRFVSGTIAKDRVKLHTPTVTIGIRGTIVKVEVRSDGSGTVFFEHGQGDITNARGETVQMTQGDTVSVGADGALGKPAQKHWNAGDSAVDAGLNAFGQSFTGPGAGSGGGDGVGAASATGNAATGN